jgi:hypothetical protein
VYPKAIELTARISPLRHVDYWSTANSNAVKGSSVNLWLESAKCETLLSIITGFLGSVYRPVFYVETRKHNVSETGSISFHRWGTPSLLGPLERVGVFPPHLRAETDPISETLCSLVSRIPDDGQSPVILSIIHHRQNPLESLSHVVNWLTSGAQRRVLKLFQHFGVGVHFSHHIEDERAAYLTK